jgi:acyl-CoA synthetase (NDP forming)
MTVRPRRPLYTHAELQPLVRPSSVAVVGASETRDGVGTRALQRIASASFAGELWAVHPKLDPGASLHGGTVARSLRDLDGGVDCALIAVPGASVEQVVLDAAEAGCRSAIVFSAGFGEVSEEGKATERRLLEIASAHGMRLGGPNTAGILNYRDGLPLTFVSDLAMELPAGNLAIVSQSAGIATHLGHVRHRGTGVSFTITTGNSADVTAFDYVAFLLEDDATDVVALVIEGLDDSASLAAVGAKSLACGKPIVMIKCGRTDAGGRAAVSHTGSLAGNYDVFLAAAAEAGIRVVQTTEELIETATLFARWAGAPYRAGGVAVVTTMGGPGVIAADAAADAGLRLPEPCEATRGRLGELLPSFAATSNPIDTTASPPDDVLGDVIVAVGEDTAYTATVLLAATMTGPSTAGRPAAIAAAADRLAAPLATVWLSSWREGPGTELLDRHPRMPVFRSSDRCMRAIAHWVAWQQRLDDAPVDGAAFRLGEREIDELRAAVAISVAGGGGALDEAESRALLATAGIHAPDAGVATTADEAVAIACRIGFPVVAKVVSRDVPHKASAGGVALGLTSPDAIAEAFRRITEGVARSCPDAAIDGVLIAESLDTGMELMCGLIRDPVFGPVIVCGAGGGTVEQINDVAYAVAPVTSSNARRAVRRLRIVQRLAGMDRGLSDRVESGLSDVMMRLAALAEAAAEITEVDVNPVVLRPDGIAVALDALVVVAPASSAP